MQPCRRTTDAFIKIGVTPENCHFSCVGVFFILSPDVEYPLAPCRFARAVGYFSRVGRQICVPLRQIKRNKLRVFVWWSGAATTAAEVFPFEVRFEQRGPLVMTSSAGKSFRVFTSPQKNPVRVKYAAVHFCEEWPRSFTGKFYKKTIFIWPTQKMNRRISENPPVRKKKSPKFWKFLNP